AQQRLAAGEGDAKGLEALDDRRVVLELAAAVFLPIRTEATKCVAALGHLYVENARRVRLQCMREERPAVPCILVRPHAAEVSNARRGASTVRASFSCPGRRHKMGQRLVEATAAAEFTLAPRVEVEELVGPSGGALHEALRGQVGQKWPPRLTDVE